MDTKTLADFIAWSKTTDLQEVLYNKDGVNIEIKTEQANPRASDFSTPLKPVKAPAVGIYHAGKKGCSVNLKENMPVKEGDFLGAVEMNKTFKDITANAEGNLKIISISDGKPVEFGQPLFFIEPK